MFPKILIISSTEKLYEDLSERLQQQYEIIYQNDYYFTNPCMNVGFVFLCIIESFCFTKESATLVKNLKKRMNVPILFVSNSRILSQKVKEKVRAIDSGVDEYLSYPVTTEEIVASMKALIRWQIRMIGTPEITNGKGLKIIPDSRQVFVNGNPVQLTRIEFNILHYLASKCNRAVTYKEICEKIWKEEYLCDDAKIMAHIHRLRNKLKQGTHNPTYIQNVHGVGYRFCC